MNEVSLDDIAIRLDRIEKAIIQLTERLPAKRTRKKALPTDNTDKERCFHNFIAKNIKIASPYFQIKRIEIWERYTETVEKKNRINQKAFFERLKAAFPDITIDKIRIGTQFQFFCSGINLK